MTSAPVSAASGESNAPQPQLEITCSRNFTAWLAQNRLSLAFTTYQSGKIFFIGLQPGGRLSVFERTFNRAMGMVVHEGEIYLSTLYQVWRFVNMLLPGQAFDGYDRLYVPRTCHVTGELDIHDMVVDADGRLAFVNTLFGCVATTDEHHCFRPLWKPPFLERLAAEDRCHLNGLALRDGRPRYVTAVSKSNVVDGWRDRRHDGGIVMDIQSNEELLGGLSMPHSPRWYRDRLWLLNSGTGEFGYADLNTGKFEPIAFCPGYARGLAFAGDFAIVGLSRARENKSFQGLALDDALAERDAEARCGLLVIDIRTGDTVEWMRIEGVVQELYDVAVLPGAMRPMALGFKTDEIRRFISFE